MRIVKMIKSFIISIILSYIILAKSQLPTYTPLLIRVGLFFPTKGDLPFTFENSAGAISLAVDRIIKDGIIPPGINFTFKWVAEECVQSTSAGLTYELIEKDKVDLIIAPPCNKGALFSGMLATYYNIPIAIWGLSFSSRLTNSVLYPTMLSISPTYKDFAQAICAIMQYYNWTTFGFVYQTSQNRGCSEFQSELDDATNSNRGCSIGYKNKINITNTSDVTFTIQQLKKRARIIVFCFDDIRQRRTFSLHLYDAGMYTPDYVYITADIDVSLATEQPFWFYRPLKNESNDGRDNDARRIGMISFQIRLYQESNLNFSLNDFSQQVILRIRDWPFFCKTCNQNQNASIYAPFLYDTFYAYAVALSSTIHSSKNFVSNIYRNGVLLAKNNNTTFQGLTGKVVLNTNGLRDSSIVLVGRNKNYSITNFLILQLTKNCVKVTETPESVNYKIWDTRNGFQPVAIPLCGFDGQRCPIPVFDLYKGFFIAGIVIVGLLIIIAILLIYYACIVRRRKIRRLNEQWQILFATLTKVEKGKGMPSESSKSLLSGPSTTSKFTSSVGKSKNYTIYNYNQEHVIAIKHFNTIKIHLTEQDMAEYRAMCQFDHDNINKFYGLSLDGPNTLSLWKFCSRGSLKDVLNNNTLAKDAVFMFFIIWEICEGICFIHNSSLNYHGNLKSTYCLIDERWQVKLSYYGLQTFRRYDATDKKAQDLLWKAPELLREATAAAFSENTKFSNKQKKKIEKKNNESKSKSIDYSIGSKAGDIYSFAIIASEIVNMKSAWEEPNDGPERYRNHEEIVYMVKKGGILPPRPTIKPVVADLNPALQHLIRDCWSENPTDRPKIELVRSLLRSMRTAGRATLMDYVFNMLEKYADTLQDEVEERTKELVAEKKKSDVLLYRMLPKIIADRLKMGQSVEPEFYSCVTVLFSDVVSFTTLSSRMKPLNVVNFLNDLYTNFDSIIAEYDVYKVETIGDGYLCVSGLPHRNGNKHAQHVANMSLRFIRSLANISIAGLPEERVSLRIGCHSGPCVTGVVGLAMPRYCLFGDTINTASRMESSSMANKIHISAETNHFLTEVIGGYLTEKRGEVIIKGKGVMETYWLIGHSSGTSTNSPPKKSTAIEKTVVEPVTEGNTASILEETPAQKRPFLVKNRNSDNFQSGSSPSNISSKSSSNGPQLSIKTKNHPTEV